MRKKSPRRHSPHGGSKVPAASFRALRISAPRFAGHRFGGRLFRAPSSEVELLTWADHFRTAKNQEVSAVEHRWQCESDHRAGSYRKPGQHSTPIRLKSQVRGPQRLREFFPKTAKRRTATSKSKMPAAPRLTVRPLEGRKAHSRKRHGVRSPGQITFALPKWETFVNLDSYGSAKVILTSKSPNGRHQRAGRNFLQPTGPPNAQP